jgi:hypothetical protein
MAGRYKSITRPQLAERLFPIRIRIRASDPGYPKVDRELDRWLAEHAGPNRHGTSPGGVREDHYVFIHLPTVALAQAFLEAWKDRLDIDLRDDEVIRPT